MKEATARKTLGTTRTIMFSGGIVYVSLPPDSPSGPVVGLSVYGCDEKDPGVTIALSVSKADELAQALREFALAAAQASAALVATDRVVEVRS